MLFRRGTVTRQSLLLWGLVIVTGVWLVTTIVFVSALASTTSALSRHLVPRGVSTTVLLLKVLVDGVGLWLGILMATSLTLLQWTSVKGPGLSYSSFLAMSPTTGFLGMMQLLKWNTTKSRIFRGWHVGWIILRYSSSILKLI